MKILLECTAPLAHGAFGESAGNATLIRRMPLVSVLGMPRVPCVSGNAFRGAMRRLVMRDLLQRSGLSRGHMAPQAWDRLYAAIANGGHLDGSETKVDPDEIRQLRESLPPLSLFGAALYSWMLPGHMSVGILWPDCFETRLAGLSSTQGEVAPYAEDLVVEVSQCRHVDREHQDTEVSGVTPMPTTIETLAPGTRLEGRIDYADHCSEVERAVIPYALSKLRVLGGKSGSGFGAVNVLESSGSPEAYDAWLASTTDLQERLLRLAAKLTPSAKKAKQPKGE